MTRVPLLRALTSSAVIAILLTGCTGDYLDDDLSNRKMSGASEAPEPQVLDPMQPAATVCTDGLGAVEVPGDLLVPRGSTCRLEGTAVAGRVTVENSASLTATDARFGEGISAHAYERIELLRGKAEGRPPTWFYETEGSDSRVVDFVFDGGRELVIEDGPVNGAYYVLDTTGQAEVSRLSLDLGSVYCAGNKKKPVVRRISSESFGALQGQCAGLKGFGQTDF